MLNDILSNLGITEEEAKAYVLLLEMGSATVSQLAQKMGKPRPSLYGFLKRLQAKGLVTQSMKMSVRTFAAEQPLKISLLLKQKAEDMAEKHKSFQNLLPELEKTIPSKFLSPKFQLYEGEEGLKHVLRDMLLYRNIETQAFWPIKSMVDILSPEFFRYHNKERIRNNIYTRALWPLDKMVDIQKHPYLGSGKEFKREIRTAPKGVDFSMGYWIYNDKVAFISSRKESFGFIIESRELVETLLVQFEIMWKLSKPLKTKTEYSAGFLRDINAPVQDPNVFL
mgnify:CR=1 FL=1